jgi:hypothetical protein
VQGRLDGLDAVAHLQRRLVFEHTLQGQLDRLAQARQLLGRCIAHGELLAVEIAASPVVRTAKALATGVDRSGGEGSARQSCSLRFHVIATRSATLAEQTQYNVIPDPIYSLL